MRAGTLFLWLFLILAPTFALLFVWVTTRRIRCEPGSRWTLLAYAAVALGLWVAASNGMFWLVFDTVWGLAHAPAASVGSFFPEGWSIYGFTAAYFAFGVAILVALQKLPWKKAWR